MNVISSLSEMSQKANQLRDMGHTIALVPTMGSLHEGHASLLRLARQKADIVVMSLFVNPIQFGPNEDFAHYPRDVEKDLRVAQKNEVDIVFTPSSEDMYPNGFETTVQVPHLSLHLCGLSRPDFLTGVATVITILFHITKPHIAVFGEKDYQQILVIRRLVEDLHFDIDIIGAPIVREADGLAMSSRNAYLTPTERKIAPMLYQALCQIREIVQKNIRETALLKKTATDFLAQEPAIQLEYLECKEANTLQPVMHINTPTLIAIAARLGNTRLIDNLVLF